MSFRERPPNSELCFAGCLFGPWIALAAILRQRESLQSFVVNWRAISHVTRGANETAQVHVKGRREILPVSRTYLSLFRQM